MGYSWCQALGKWWLWLCNTNFTAGGWEGQDFEHLALGTWWFRNWEGARTFLAWFPSGILKQGSLLKANKLMLKGSKPLSFPPAQWPHPSCLHLECVRHGKVVPATQNLEPAEGGCMCVLYSINQVCTCARVAVHIQIKSVFGSEHLEVSAVPGVKAQNSTTLHLTDAPCCAEGEADCHLWEDLQCLNSGCRFLVQICDPACREQEPDLCLQMDYLWQTDLWWFFT